MSDESGAVKEHSTSVGNEHGKGVTSSDEVYTYEGGAKYQGDWKDQLRHGKGTYTKPNGESYTGEWKENTMHGKGTFTWPAGGKYTGEFKDGLVHGQGRYDYAPDQYYEGEWNEDMKHGKGKIIFPGGDSYEGEWRNNERHGHGVYKLVKNGMVYHGGYANSLRAGQGYLSERGKYYEVKSNRQDGKAIAQIEISKDEFDSATGALSAGQKWPSKLEAKLATLNIAPDLQYKSYTFQSGATYEGTWKGTKRHGTGEWKHPEGDSYIGQYDDNKEHGWGVFTFGGAGKKYCGQWRNGQMHGFGVYLFSPDGKERNEGYYADDKKHGKGLYTFPDGAVKFQTWNNGALSDERDPSRSDLEFIRDLTLDAIEQLEKVAPGHLRFLESAWIELFERFKREEADAAKKKAADEADKKRKAEADKKADEDRKKEEAERKKAEEAERKRREEAEKKAREEADKKAAEEKKKMEEEAARKAKAAEAAEAERKRKAEEEEARRKAEEEAIKPKVFRNYTYAELKLPESKLTRHEVDYTQRELHLTDAEFETVFGISKEKYKASPQWKMDELRKKHKLY